MSTGLKRARLPDDAVHARLPLVIYAQGVGRDADAAVAAEHQLCLLMAQLGRLRQIAVATQNQQLPPALVLSDGVNRRGHVGIQSLGKAKRDALPRPELRSLLIRDGGGIVPRITVDELAERAALRPCGEVFEPADRQIRQRVRREDILVAVAGGAVDPRLLGPDADGSREQGAQARELGLDLIDAGLDLLAGGVAVAALEDGGLERGDVLRGGGIIPVRELTAQGEDAVGDGAVELERGVAVEIGLQRELQLLELQLLLPNPG